MPAWRPGRSWTGCPTSSAAEALFCGDILTTAYGALRNAGLQPGETVAVIGCGPVGLMAVRSAFAQWGGPGLRRRSPAGPGRDGGARIVAVGVTTAESFAFPLATSLTRDISFRIGLANIHRDIDATLALVAAGRIDPAVIVSHRLPLSEAPAGYRLFDDREAMKVLLLPGA